jgi:hypothetical protein
MNDRRPYSLLQIRDPAVEVLLAGAEGATFLAMVSRIS